MKTLIPLIAVAALALSSCERVNDRAKIDTEAIYARQLVVEEFGPDVWDSSVYDDTFIARCPDGSVWFVTFSRFQSASRWTVEQPTRIAAKTLIFDAMVKPTVEKP